MSGTPPHGSVSQGSLKVFLSSRKHPPASNVKVCGDFNSDTRSAVYELMSTQGVSPDHPDLSNDPCHVLPDASELTHSELGGVSIVGGREGLANLFLSPSPNSLFRCDIGRDIFISAVFGSSSAVPPVLFVELSTTHDT